MGKIIIIIRHNVSRSIIEVILLNTSITRVECTLLQNTIETAQGWQTYHNVIVSTLKNDNYIINNLNSEPNDPKRLNESSVA